MADRIPHSLKVLAVLALLAVYFVGGSVLFGLWVWAAAALIVSTVLAIATAREDRDDSSPLRG